MIPEPTEYRMPAEWESHTATWLTWPHNPETWPGQDMAAIEAVYLAMTRALHDGEQVHILINDAVARDRVASRLPESGIDPSCVSLHVIPTNDSWIRDYGPNFLLSRKDSRLGANKWLFDSWGGKYPSEKDNAAGHVILKTLVADVFEPNIVLEGGAIEVNGSGTCMTTRDCLLNPNRNGGLDQTVMEGYLRRHLGVTEILWCEGDLEGDDTDGHIDNLARFVRPDTVLCAVEEDPRHPNHACTRANLELLQAAAVSGTSAVRQVVPLPMPDPVLTHGEALPASYANFYIGNSAVLVPGYGGPKDEVVVEILRNYFPERRIKLIPSAAFIHGLGGLHCVTQQQPAAGKFRP